MSFRVDLWNGVNTIKNQFSSIIDKISNLYNLLLSYANYQKAFSKNLESLYKLHKDRFKDDYLLDKTLSVLIDNIKSESELHKRSYIFIKEELMESLKENSEKEKSIFNDLLNEGMQLPENFITIKNNVINKQKNYNDALKDFYDFINDFDESEIKSILEDDDMPIIRVYTTIGKELPKIFPLQKLYSETNIQFTNKDDNMINNISNIDKKRKFIEKINEKKHEYINTLKESNEFLYIYKNKYENILQSLEEEYKKLLSNLLLTLTSSIGHKINLNNELNLLYNSFMENNLSNINIEHEIREFIVRNVTKEFPLNKFEMFVNKFENKKFDIIKYLNEKDINFGQDIRRGKSHKKNEMKIFMRRSILKKNTNDKSKINNILENISIKNDIKEYKIKTNICLIEDFVEELILDREEDENNDDYYSAMMDIDIIKSLISKKNEDHLVYLESLIKTLNKNRAKGNFLIIKKSYNIFIDIFNFILNNHSNIDFILKNIIILSQTFYIIEGGKDKINMSKNKTKIFIQNGIKNNPIFNNPETWHRVINYTLSTNICNKDISQTVDKNEINNKLNLMSHNILISFLCDIKYFTDDKKVFDEIKDFYVKIYNMNEDSINKEVNSVINIKPKN